MKLKKVLMKTTAFITAGMMCVMSPMSMIGDVLHTGVITVEAADYTSGDWEYNLLEDGTVEIAGYTGEATEIVIPGEIDGKSVTGIGNYAFDGCSSLTSIKIPETVTSIWECAFSRCSSLTNIQVSENNNYYVSEEGVLFDKKATILVKYPEGKKGEYTIPEGVTSIWVNAFSGCSSLTGITIPEGVTEILESAFAGCSSLTSITIPKGVTSIDACAFYQCSSLTNVTIPEGVTHIWEYAFYKCSSLTSIEIPNGVTHIMGNAFEECSGLTSITIPESVTYIGYHAFYNCVNLTIYSTEDAYAHTYAIKNDINWKLLDELPDSEPTDIASLTVSLSDTSFVYDGIARRPGVTITDGDKVLVNGTDYTVEYSNNTNVGTATLSVTGQGNYTGTVARIFQITPAKISTATLATISSVYTGKAQTPSVTVKSGTRTLKNGTDYTVTYTNNINPGTAKVTITGKGNYTGTITNTFTIKPAVVTALKQKASYSTSAISMTWKKAAGVTGYEVYRATGKNGKYTKVATTSANSYTNKSLKAGTNYYYKVRAYKTVGSTKIYGSYSSAVAMSTKTAAPSAKITAGSKSAKITWKKVTGASGYEVYMSTTKNGKYTRIKTVSSKTATYTKTRLTKNKNYYFKIRSFKSINGSKVYSSWSSVKSVKAK